MVSWKIVALIVVIAAVAFPFIKAILSKIPASIFKFFGFVIVLGLILYLGYRFLSSLEKPGQFN